MKNKFTLKLFTDDMGSFTQPGCNDDADALWHVNSARQHDHLKPLTPEQFAHLLRGAHWGHAKKIFDN